MFKKLAATVGTALCVGAVCAQPSYALFDVEGMIGYSSASISGAKIGSSDIKATGTQLGVAAHVDPIPLVPIAFGLGVTMPTTTGKDSAGNKIAVNGLLVDLEVMAWTPISFLGFTPFAKVGYIAFGAYTVTQSLSSALSVGGKSISGSQVGSSYTYGFKSSGLTYGVGVKYSLIPLVKIFGQISMNSETAKPTKVNVAGVDTSLLGSPKIASTAFLVGVEAGI